MQELSSRVNYVMLTQKHVTLKKTTAKQQTQTMKSTTQQEHHFWLGFAWLSYLRKGTLEENCKDIRERSVGFEAEGERLSAALPARTTGEKCPARRNTEVPSAWLCQADTVSCQVLGAPQVKGRTWLWSVGDNQSGAGPSPVQQAAVPL